MLLKLLILAIPAVLVVPSASAAFEGKSGTITFSGVLASDTCTLSEDSKNKEIIVRDIPRGDVPSIINTRVDTTDFTLDILCDSYISGTAGISFTGPNFGSLTLLSSDHEKTNAGYIMKYAPTGDFVNLSGKTQYKLKLKPGTNVFPFQLGYVKIRNADPVRHGPVNASVNYTIHYE